MIARENCPEKALLLDFSFKIIVSPDPALPQLFTGSKIQYRNKQKNMLCFRWCVSRAALENSGASIRMSRTLKPAGGLPCVMK